MYIYENIKLKLTNMYNYSNNYNNKFKLKSNGASLYLKASASCSVVMPWRFSGSLIVWTSTLTPPLWPPSCLTQGRLTSLSHRCTLSSRLGFYEETYGLAIPRDPSCITRNFSSSPSQMLDVHILTSSQNIFHCDPLFFLFLSSLKTGTMVWYVSCNNPNVFHQA